MRNNIKFYVFVFTFFLCLCLPSIEAATEAPEKLPFPNPEVLISMDFQDAGLKDILKIFSIQSSLNFIASDAVKDRKFTLYFDNVPIKDAMDKIFKANNLSYELDSESNIFIVTDLGAPEVKTVTRIFYLKFASVSASSIVMEKENPLVITDISSVGGGKAGSSAKTSGITAVIEKLLSDKGKVIEDTRTNSLIITDVPNRLENIAAVIASLDIPQSQVLLEVEMMDVNKDATEKIGMKFATPLLDVTMTNSGASWMSKWPTGSILGDPSNNFSNGTFTVGSTSYRLILDFLKTQSDTQYLARPRILTLNNETAEIKISTDEAIGLTSTTETQTGTTTTEAERAQTGVLLRVTPQINMETGEITMYVIPAVAEAATGGTFGGTTFKDPEIRYTKSMVRVKDGETIVIGGLIRRNSSETITRLPFFSSIPFLGQLFTHKNKEKDKERELLVFITPHIIRDTSVQLARAKTGAFPQREQSSVSNISRQAIIDASLKSFEKTKK